MIWYSRFERDVEQRRDGETTQTLPESERTLYEQGAEAMTGVREREFDRLQATRVYLRRPDGTA